MQAQPVIDSLENVKKNKVEHLVSIERRDIFKLDLSGADVVTLWLLPPLNVRLIPQLEKMKPGSRIISWDFDMMDIIKPDKVIEMDLAPELEMGLLPQPWGAIPKRYIRPIYL